MSINKNNKHFNCDVLIVSRERLDSLWHCCQAVLNNSLLPKTLIIIQANNSANAKQVKEKISKIARSKGLSLIFKNVADLGISYSRNLALHEVTSPYFAFIDDDEIVPSNWLSVAATIWKKYPDLTAISGPKIPKQIEQNYWHWVFYKLIIEPTLQQEQTVDFVTSGNSFFKTAFVRKNQITFDNSFARASEDEVFSLKLQQAGALFKFFPQLTVQHQTKTKFKAICQQFFTYGEMGLRFHHEYHDPYSKKIKRFLKCLFFIKPFQIGQWQKNNPKLNFGYLSINSAYRLGRIWGLIKYF